MAKDNVLNIVKRVLYIVATIVGLCVAAAFFAAVLYALNSGMIEDFLYSEAFKGLDLGIEYYEKYEHQLFDIFDAMMERLQGTEPPEELIDPAAVSFS